MNEITREELDAKLEATNARVDARLAQFESTVREALAATRQDLAEMRQDSAEMRGELKAIHVDLSYLKNLKANIWGAAVVAIGLVGAMQAYGVARFDSGRETTRLVQEVKQQAIETRQVLERIQAQLNAAAYVVPEAGNPAIHPPSK